MTKKKFEVKVRQLVDEIQENRETFFRVSIINIEPIENKRNQGEALIQILLHSGGMNMCAVAPVYYFTSTSRREEQLNRNVLTENKEVVKLINGFYRALPEEVRKETKYPDVIVNQIANKIIELYKDCKKEFCAEVI